MTQAAILCRATDDIGSKWLSVDRPRRVENRGRIRHVGAGGGAREGHFAHEWTFTTRSFDDAIATYAALPDDIAKLGQNSHATILCPEGGGVENQLGDPAPRRNERRHRRHRARWQVPTPVPDRAGGGMVREPAVEVLRAAQDFGKARARPPAGRTARRTIASLLVRHGWAAREIAPDAFAPVRSGPVVTDEAGGQATCPRCRRTAQRPSGEARRERREVPDRSRRAARATRGVGTDPRRRPPRLPHRQVRPCRP